MFRETVQSLLLCGKCIKSENCMMDFFTNVLKRPRNVFVLLLNVKNKEKERTTDVNL